MATRLTSRGGIGGSAWCLSLGRRYSLTAEGTSLSIILNLKKYKATSRRRKHLRKMRMDRNSRRGQPWLQTIDVRGSVLSGLANQGQQRLLRRATAQLLQQPILPVNKQISRINAFVEGWINRECIEESLCLRFSNVRCRPQIQGKEMNH
jgi:hypothetical protein